MRVTPFAFFVKYHEIKMRSTYQNLSPIPSPLRGARNSLSYYYDPGVNLAEIARVLTVAESHLWQASRRELSCIYVVALWGMRIGEYLSATAGDLLGNDFLLIHGEKRSASYRIMLPGIDAQFAADAGSCPGRLVAGTTYTRVYRQCVKLHIGRVLSEHKNLARTHAGRYYIAATVIRHGRRVASDLLHHRSDTAITSYVDAGG